MKIARSLTSWGRGVRASMVGSLLITASMVVGCSESTPSSQPGGGTSPPAAAPAPAATVPGKKGQLDTSSRRQHQKEHPGSPADAK